MKVPITALMSVVLVLTTLSAISKPTFDVNVLNFPLDEQGNLKTSYVPTSKVLTLIRDMNVSWTEGTEYIGVNSEAIEVEYDEIVFYLSFKNWSVDLRYWITVHFIVDGIRVTRGTGAAPKNLWTPYITPHNKSEGFHASGTERVLIINVNPKDPQPSGWFLVSASLYLRN